MATEAPAGLSAPPDEGWMRSRLEELCSGERGSASEGERRAAEWLAGELREAGALTGLAARRGGRAARALATLTGAAAAALIADELPPGRRRFRRMLPKRT